MKLKTKGLSENTVLNPKIGWGSRSRKQRGKRRASRVLSPERPKRDIRLSFQLTLLEVQKYRKWLENALVKLLTVSFQVSGLFMTEENTLYVNINFVIRGILDIKDKKGYFIFLCSNFACVQLLFATYFKMSCLLTRRNTGKIPFGILCI